MSPHEIHSARERRPTIRASLRISRGHRSPGLTRRAHHTLIALLAPLIALSGLARAAETPIDLDLYARLLQAHTRSVDDIVGVRVDYRGLATAPEWLYRFPVCPRRPVKNDDECRSMNDERKKTMKAEYRIMMNEGRRHTE